MRLVVAGLSAGAALAFIAASGLMNWVFMNSLGKSAFEQQILGAVSLAVSAFLALFPTLLVWAFRERRTLYIILGVPVFLTFAAFSLSSAVGFSAKNRGSVSEDRALAAATLAGIRQPSSRNPCAASNRIAAGSLRNPARTRQPTPRALSAKAISISSLKRQVRTRLRFWKLTSANSKAKRAALKTKARAGKPTIRPPCLRVCLGWKPRRSNAR